MRESRSHSKRKREGQFIAANETKLTASGSSSGSEARDIPTVHNHLRTENHYWQ